MENPPCFESVPIFPNGTYGFFVDWRVKQFFFNQTQKQQTTGESARLPSDSESLATVWVNLQSCITVGLGKLLLDSRRTREIWVWVNPSLVEIRCVSSLSLRSAFYLLAHGSNVRNVTTSLGETHHDGWGKWQPLEALPFPSEIAKDPSKMVIMLYYIISY